MDSLNEVKLIGRLVEDPQLNTYDSGAMSVRTRMATNYRHQVKKEDGSTEWESVGVFHNFEVWGSDAKYLATYGKKGAFIVVLAQLRYGKYEDKNYAHVSDKKDDGSPLYLMRYPTTVAAIPGGIILPRMDGAGNSSQAPSPNTPPPSDAPPPAENGGPIPF